MMKVLARNWWALALRGLFAILFGVAAFAWPNLTLAALVILFGAYALVDGVFALVTAVRAAEAHERWWLFVLEGLAGIVVGIITFIWPGITALVLLYLIAWWALITGVFEIAAAIRLRKQIRQEWTLVLGGLASVVFGLLLFYRPGARARRGLADRNLCVDIWRAVPHAGLPAARARRADACPGLISSPLSRSSHTLVTSTVVAWQHGLLWETRLSIWLRNPPSGYRVTHFQDE